MGLIEELSERISAVADRLGGSVVRIGGGWRGGSGFVIGDGLVLTNAHNVRGEQVHVLFADGRQAAATLKGVDLDGDLAVLAVDTAGTPAVEWAGGETRLGTTVLGVALSGGGGPRVTVGWVSAAARPFRGPHGRRIAGALEHTAPLAPGSSGGPLADSEGRVVGINTNRIGTGFYLALPADEALQGRIAALARGQSPRRPRLGVAIAPAHAARAMRRAVGLPEQDGLLVREVEDGSPAAAAGIAEGDLLVSAGGRLLADADDLYDALGGVGDGGALELKVLRGAAERTVSVSFAAGTATDGSGEDGPVH